LQSVWKLQHCYRGLRSIASPRKLGLRSSRAAAHATPPRSRPCRLARMVDPTAELGGRLENPVLRADGCSCSAENRSEGAAAPVHARRPIELRRSPSIAAGDVRRQAVGLRHDPIQLDRRWCRKSSPFLGQRDSTTERPNTSCSWVTFTPGAGESHTVGLMTSSALAAGHYAASFQVNLWGTRTLCIFRSSVMPVRSPRPSRCRLDAFRGCYDFGRMTELDLSTADTAV
jgi:hypothetical protein